MKAFAAQYHPTTQKFVVALSAILAMVAAFNWLSAVQASSVTAVIIALAAFFDPVKP